MSATDKDKKQKLFCWGSQKCEIVFFLLFAEVGKEREIELFTIHLLHAVGPVRPIPLL
jgi:hypothetical protein